MTESQAVNQVQVENKPSDKELNFRAIEAKLREERAARLEAERKVEEAQRQAQDSQRNRHDEEEDDNEPYVEHKKLDRKLAKFGQNTQGEIQKAMEIAKNQAKEELKQEMWLDKNADFYDVMQHAKKLYEDDREMAETILTMPDTFERQKLVYQTIKKLGLHQEKKQHSIQEKINSNQRSPYYQPSGISAAPYSAQGDFSPAGQKNAYDNMKKLQSKLRM